MKKVENGAKKIISVKFASNGAQLVYYEGKRISVEEAGKKAREYQRECKRFRTNPADAVDYDLYIDAKVAPQLVIGGDYSEVVIYDGDINNVMTVTEGINGRVEFVPSHAEKIAEIAEETNSNDTTEKIEASGLLRKATFAEVRQKVSVDFRTGKNGRVNKIWSVYFDTGRSFTSGFYKVDYRTAKETLAEYDWTVAEFVEETKKDRHAKGLIAAEQDAKTGRNQAGWAMRDASKIEHAARRYDLTVEELQEILARVAAENENAESAENENTVGSEEPTVKENSESAENGAAKKGAGKIKITDEMIGLTTTDDKNNKGYYWCNFKALQIGGKYFPARRIYVGASSRIAEDECGARDAAVRKAIEEAGSIEAAFTGVKSVFGSYYYNALQKVLDASPNKHAVHFFRKYEHLIKVSNAKKLYSTIGGFTKFRDQSISFHLENDAGNNFRIFIHEAAHSIDMQVADENSKKHGYGISPHRFSTIAGPTGFDWAYQQDGEAIARAGKIAGYGITKLIENLKSEYPLPNYTVYNKNLLGFKASSCADYLLGGASSEEKKNMVYGYYLPVTAVNNRLKLKKGVETSSSDLEVFAELLSYAITCPDYYEKLKNIIPATIEHFENLLRFFDAEYSEPTVETSAELDAPQVNEPEKVENPQNSEPSQVNEPPTVESVETIHAATNFKGEVIEVTFNGLTTAAMCGTLEARGFNFATSYLILIKAVINGSVTVSQVSAIGDNSQKWSNACKKTNYTQHSQYWVKRNINATARAIFAKRLIEGGENFMSIESITKKKVNSLLQAVFEEPPQGVEENQGNIENNAPQVNEPPMVEENQDTINSEPSQVNEPPTVEEKTAPVNDVPAPQNKNFLEVIIPNIRRNSKGKVVLTYNDRKSRVDMFVTLEAQGLNFESSYNLLLRAVLCGKATVSSAKIVEGDTVWSALPTLGQGWANHTAAKNNLLKVATAIFEKSYKVAGYKATASTNEKQINGLLFNLQQHSAAKKSAPVNSAPNVETSVSVENSQNIEPPQVIEENAINNDTSQANEPVKVENPKKDTPAPINSEPTKIVIKAKDFRTALKEKKAIEAEAREIGENVIVEIDICL